MKNVRNIFSVYIHNTKYDVYDINDKEHDGYNNIPKTWWLYFDEKGGEGWVHPPLDSKHWVPFDVSIKRHLWEFEIKQTNSNKIKWNDNSFSNNISITMICNKKKIYSFGTFDMNFALSKLQYLQVVLTEHPYNFLNPEEELGRKIYWYGLPATVKPNTTYPGEIGIVPEYSEKLSKQEWWDELEKRSKPFIPKEYKSDWEKQDDEIFDLVNDENRYDDYINWGDALSDGDIDWFRI